MITKPVLLSALFIFGISSSYSNCLRDICVNNTVIDGYDYIGKVVSVDEDKNKITYKRSGYSSVLSVNPTEISPRIESERFPTNKKVIDTYDYIGTVSQVFKDGRIQYQRIGYSSKLITKNLTPKVSNLGSLHIGQDIIDTYDYLGVVKETFEDGRVQYQRNGYSSNLIVKSGKLTIKVNNIGEYAPGKVVIDNYDYIGKIKNLFEDGRIQYVRDGYSSKLITKKLTLKTDRIKNLSTGTIVIDNYDYTGKVLLVFQDGRIQYKRDGYSSKLITKNLVEEVTQLTSGLEKDKIAVDNYDYVGEVSKVFADGRIKYKRIGYTSDIITKNLSIEVDESDHYNKEDEYASGLSFGKAIRFFKNGKIQMNTNNGKRVVSSMFPEIDSVGSLTIGDNLTIVSEKNYSIEKLFSNSTAKITVLKKNYNGDDIRESVLTKIIDLKSSDRALGQRLNQWVQNINYHLENNQDNRNGSLYTLNNLTDNSINTKDYAELEVLLINYIQENNRNLNLSKSEVKNVLNFLENTQVSETQMPTNIIQVDEAQTDEINTYQVVLNKRKLSEAVTSVLNELNLNYVIVSNSELVENAPVIRFNFKKLFSNRTCDLNVQINNTSITKVIKKNRSGVLVECLDQLRNILNNQQ